MRVTVTTAAFYAGAFGERRSHPFAFVRRAWLCPRDASPQEEAPMTNKPKSLTPEQGKDALAFRITFAIAFGAFLLEAVVRRVFARNGRSGEGAGTRKSVVAEALAAAGTCVPFAFMG